MPVKLSYSIKPVDVVEASASTNPDDLSIVPLRILVDSDPSATATVFLDHINIVVRIPSQTSGAIPVPVKTLILTARPKSITPVAGQFNVWELKFDSERTAADTAVAALGVNEAVFRANPVTTGTARTIAVVPNSTQQPFEFTLRDLEVVDHDGETVIVIEEFTRATANPASVLTKETKNLPVQKVFPALRIERFVASPPVTTAGVAVQLSWTTKGAEGGVELEGFPRERTAIVPGQPPTGGDPVVPTGGTAVSALIKSVPHTGTQEVSPRVTTTYTLRASNGVSAQVAAQVTVTVRDLTVAPALAVGDDAFSRSHRPAAGALQVQANFEAQGSVTAASVEAGGLVHAQTVTAEGAITGGSLTTSGTLNAGAATLTSLTAGNVSVDTTGVRSPKLTATTGIVGLDKGMRVIAQQVVFSHADVNSGLLVTAPTGAAAPVGSTEDGRLQARLVETGLKSGPNEKVLAHWYVPIDNVLEITKIARCFTFESFGEVNLLVQGVPGATFIIRMIVYALVVTSA